VGQPEGGLPASALALVPKGEGSPARGRCRSPPCPGACAFLLRSAHSYIYGRSFDLRRKPEYTNRILLGAVSGGAIILFSDYLVSQEDTTVHVGSAALGFIAGYSTDFLFNTVERAVGALFPKTERPRPHRAPSATVRRF
jgi:hypothetical protein